MKPGKLAPKFIGPFKILEYISESVYKLEFPNLYNRLYLTFHISLLEEYIVKKGQDPDLYLAGEFPELADNNEEQEWEVEAIINYKQDGRYKEC